MLLDHGARLIGGIGIADVQGDVLLPDGENGALVEHLGAGVAQLPELIVSNLGDGLGIVNDPGICHENTGNVGPVFVHIRIQGRSGQGTGDVGAATGEGLDPAVGHHAVEAGNHRAVALVQSSQSGIGSLLVHGGVELKLDPVGRVNEVKAQEACHQLGGEIFAPADQLILRNGLGVQPLLQCGKLGFQIQIDVQFVPDL